MKEGVIVLGGHVQGYGIIRIFGEHEIPSILIDRTEKNIARHSKYCCGFFKCSYEMTLDVLLNMGRNGDYKGWLLFPTDDYYVRILSQNKEILRKYYNITVDDWQVIQVFFNKRNTYKLAEKIGIPIPKTYYPNSLEGINSFSKEIDYPCIVKPAIMLDFYRYFKKKVFVCKNENELKINFLKALQIVKPDEILIQEIIPGSNENQYSVGIFYERNKSNNYLVGRRKRQHPIDFGNATTYAETVDIPQLIEYADRILKIANFWGICEVEFKYDERDGFYKFLEVNPRTWKWHFISEGAGIPFLLSLYQSILHNNAIIKKDYKKTAWRDIVIDLVIIIEMILTGTYIRSETKKVNAAVFNISDIKVFIMQLLYLPHNIFLR